VGEAGEHGKGTEFHISIQEIRHKKIRHISLFIFTNFSCFEELARKSEPPARTSALSVWDLQGGWV
jgi:hypothetical protein